MSDLLGYCAASSCSLLPTLWGPIPVQKKSVKNYPLTLLNIPQYLRLQRHSCQSLKSCLISVYSKNVTKLINTLCERSQDPLMLNLLVWTVTTGLQMVHISLMKCYKGKSCALCKVRCSLWHRHYTYMYLNNSNKYSRTSRGIQCSIQMRCSHSRLLLWSISCSTNHTHTLTQQNLNYRTRACCVIIPHSLGCRQLNVDTCTFWTFDLPVMDSLETPLLLLTHKDFFPSFFDVN